MTKEEFQTKMAALGGVTKMQSFAGGVAHVHFRLDGFKCYAETIDGAPVAWIFAHRTPKVGKYNLFNTFDELGEKCADEDETDQFMLDEAVFGGECLSCGKPTDNPTLCNKCNRIESRIAL